MHNEGEVANQNVVLKLRDFTSAIPRDTTKYHVDYVRLHSK